MVRLTECVAVQCKVVQRLDYARPYCCAIERSKGTGQLGAKRTITVCCGRGWWVRVGGGLRSWGECIGRQLGHG